MDIKETIEQLSKYNDEELELYVKTIDIDILKKIKIYLDDLYYNTGAAGVEDWKYDSIKDRIIEEEPNYIVPVGVKIRNNENRINLPFWLGSMNKISIPSVMLYYYKEVEKTLPKEVDLVETVEKMWNKLPEAEKEKYEKMALSEFDKEIASWILLNQKYQEKLEDKLDEFIFEDKLDGVSCLITVKNGKLKLYTRGDGKVGANISYLAQYFSSIPKDIKTDINVRGELIIKKKVFEEKYTKEYANPRNMVSGLVGAKAMRQGLFDVDFVAYEIIGEGHMDKPSDQLEKLKKLGFTVVRYELVENFTIKKLMTTLIRFTETSIYEIDGLIVQGNKHYKRNTSGNPSYAFAFKMRMNDNIANSEIINIEWNISKSGYLKPRIQIKPIKLKGVTINYTTGFNAKFIEDNKLGPGAIVKITRSGDVIPYIVEVVKKAKIAQMPAVEYFWNDTGVDIYTNNNNDEMCIKIISHFFKEIDVKQVGEKNVEKLYNSGLDNIFKILEATEQDFQKIPGFGLKLAERTYNNIHNGLKNLSIPIILASSSIFGFGFGKRKVILLFDNIPDILQIYPNITRQELIDMIINIEGFSTKSAIQIVDNLDNAILFLEKLEPYITTTTTQPKPKQKEKEQLSMKGLTVVFSGFRDKKIEEKIVEKGGKVTTSISKNTSLVVIPEISSKLTGKPLKAQELGIRILSKEEFLNEYIDL